jgi:hypothetical protein
MTTKEALRQSLTEVLVELVSITREVARQELRSVFGAFANGAPAAEPRNGKPSPLSGRHLNMDCRVPRCTQRSKGPKYHFICGRHLKELPPKEIARVNQAWKERHGKA